MTLHGRRPAPTHTLAGVRRPIAVLAVAAVLVGAACGGDDSDGTGDGDGDDGDAASGSAVADESEFCATVDDYLTLTEESDVFTSESQPEPAEVEALFTELRQHLDRLEAEAPEELAADIGLFATGTRDFIDAVERADYDFETLADDPEFVDLTAEFDEPAYVDAAEHLQSYAEDTCGLGG
jgi:hypothetical protein